MTLNNKTLLLFTRNFIFGAEDSLVSTVGLLAGITSAGITQREIVISGVVLICVEAFSMFVGSFLSERTTEESSPGYKIQKSNSLMAASIMFISYLLCGLIPLLPYFFIAVPWALWWSVAVSLLSLVVLGFVSAEILRTRIFKNALRMVVIGGIAIGLGMIVGTVFK